MKITEKINLDLHGLMEHGPINIVVFGDKDKGHHKLRGFCQLIEYRLLIHNNVPFQ